MPLTAVPVGIAVVGEYAPQIDAHLDAIGGAEVASQIASIVDACASWQPWAVAAAAGFVVVDGLRLSAWRHRRAIRNQLYSTTYLTARSVWVPWPPGLAAPRKAVVKVPHGSVINEARTKALVEALNQSANRFRAWQWWHKARPEWLHTGPWQMNVDWQAGSSRVVITRHNPEAAIAGLSTEHKRLAVMLAGKFPLPEARVTKVLRDDDGRETGYVISHTPSLAAAVPAFQQNLRGALTGFLGEHESGRMWTVAVRSESDTIEIKLAAPLDDYVPHIPREGGYADLARKQRNLIPFATGAGGVVGVWNVDSSSSGPHFLIAGRTGGGKTSLIRTVITEAIPRGFSWLLIDPKMIELDGMADYPGVAAVVYNLREIVEMICAVHAEMMARREFAHQTRVPVSALPLFGVVLDEFFVMSGFIRRAVKYGGEAEEQKDLKEYIKDADPLGKLAEILALIRSFGGRIVLGVQRPDAKNFGEDAGSVRDNFGTRASLSNQSMDGSMMLWDDAHAGRDLDTSVPGRATVSGPAGKPMTAQVHWTPDVDEHPTKWEQLKESERTLVTDLRAAAEDGAQIQDLLPEIRDHLTKIGGLVTPATGGPVLACFSHELRKLLQHYGSAPAAPPEAVGDLDPATAGDEGVRGAALVVGDLVHIEDRGRGVVAKVTAVKVTSTYSDGSPMTADVEMVDTDNPRRSFEARYEPNERVLTAEPVFV
ncbi:type IV secretory system conjugative DNA transfer family protein [Gordonia effusa]|uniref:type IV secretory system conjugative DNA transfer family protein n=1 Tax=Gordonia effusa TaxID=263908 RepID=UPI001478E07B|nr:FtsK/SpoIIIE domain-containing protein [Gordonia effusa]